MRELRYNHVIATEIRWNWDLMRLRYFKKSLMILTMSNGDTK